MEYRSVGTLNDRVVDWSYVLPRDLDLVVGIPRSGLLAANLLALHMDLPLTDVEGLLSGRTMQTGVRYGGPDIRRLLKRPSRILVVDDSVYSGKTMDEVRAQIESRDLGHDVQYGAVFATPQAVRHGKVTLFAEVVPGPRVFAWNIMHTPMMRDFCVDIDGVLCPDPDASAIDDGVRYLDFLRCAPPLLIPRYEVGWLVTSRLEKYRSETVAWLERNGVQFRHLIMMQYPDMASRRQAAAYSAYKADVYEETGASLFIESAAPTAQEVAISTGKPVFCFDTREMIYPGGYPRQRHLPVRPLGPAERLLHWGLRLPRRVARKAFGTGAGSGDAGPAAIPIDPDPYRTSPGSSPDVHPAHGVSGMDDGTRKADTDVAPKRPVGAAQGPDERGSTK